MGGEGSGGMLIPLFFIRRRRNIISSIRHFNDEVLTLDQDISEAFSAYYMFGPLITAL